MLRDGLLPHSPGRSAADLLAEKGYLKPGHVAALHALMEEQIAEHSGDVARSIAILERDPVVGESILLVGGRRRSRLGGCGRREGGREGRSHERGHSAARARVCKHPDRPVSPARAEGGWVG